MEKLSFVKNGVLRLPPGFRFHPTDEELVVQYLRRKMYSCPLPASVIPEADVCKSDPWDLPGDCGQERYFFSTRKVKYPNGNRSNRATGSGYWKATGLDKQIVTTKGSLVVGMKKSLVFYRGKPPRGDKTDWIMHEYRLVEKNNPNCQQSSKVELENWVLCRIFFKKRSRKNEDEEVTKCQNGDDVVDDHRAWNLGNSSRPVFYDFMSKDRTDLNLASASPSSDSSGITELSNNKESDDHGDSSSCRSLTTFRRKPWP